jgi:alanyl-tRNA synthetase
LNLDDLTNGVPKTELVYLREMTRSQLDAQILKAVPEKKTHAYVMLDRTIFHPKGGGQPSDRGELHSPQFSLALKKAIYHQKRVVHWAKILAGSVAEGPVSCTLNWPYRHLLMRRHTAAHLLDHCLANTTSRRVQTTDSWIDEPCYVGYKGSVPDEKTLRLAEALANTMIAHGAPVKIEFLTGQESKALLQSAPNFERLPDLEEIRTVTIEGCDAIPCGGTHVSNLTELQKLTIDRCEQMPNDTYRVHFSV